jgi:hypothetical protein
MTGFTKNSLLIRHTKTLVVVLAALLVIVGLFLWVRSNSGVAGTVSRSTTTTQSGTMTQINEGGQITIKVTWQGRNAGPVFAVAMETHTVDLDGYDLRQLALLRTDQGQDIQPSAWNAPAGGHHRNGTLSFPTTLADGSPVIGPNTRSIELVIRNVGGVAERSFRWTL